MLPYETALARILETVPAPVAERLPLAAADGRVLAESVRAETDLPPFDNSAMDGFAVRSGDLREAGPKSPVRLRVLGRVAAGEVFSGEVIPGTCVRLFTGSPVPSGADAVVMQEDTRPVPDQPGEVLVLEPAPAGDNIRQRGEDVARGATLLEAGEPLNGARVSLLGAAGIAGVSVARQPVIGLLATGSELAEPGQPLAPGQIYESNRLGLAALVRRAGAAALVLPIVPDDLESTRRALLHALASCDAVVTSGGVSVGEMDFVKRAWTDAGGTLDFWRVAIKPGRPFVFGRHRHQLLFGLPGNPVSALVTFLLLVRPALLRWQGATQLQLPSQAAALAEPLENRGPRRHFVRVRIDAAGTVRSAGLQASHALSSLAAASGLVDVPPETVLPQGAAVRVLRWD